jgi:hypothetical protein
LGSSRITNRDRAEAQPICDTEALFNARPVSDPGEVAALYKQVY